MERTWEARVSSGLTDSTSTGRRALMTLCALIVPCQLKAMQRISNDTWSIAGSWVQSVRCLIKPHIESITNPNNNGLIHLDSNNSYFMLIGTHTNDGADCHLNDMFPRNNPAILAATC